MIRKKLYFIPMLLFIVFVAHIAQINCMTGGVRTMTLSLSQVLASNDTKIMDEVLDRGWTKQLYAKMNEAVASDVVELTPKGWSKLWMRDINSTEKNSPLWHALYLVLNAHKKNEHATDQTKYQKRLAILRHMAKEKWYEIELENRSCTSHSLFCCLCCCCSCASVSMGPLHKAAQAGNVDTMHILIESGFKIDQEEEFDEISYRAYAAWTPLMCAAAAGKIDAVKWLLKNGARASFYAGDLATAHNVAANKEIRKLLREAVHREGPGAKLD